MSPLPTPPSFVYFYEVENELHERTTVSEGKRIRRLTVMYLYIYEYIYRSRKVQREKKKRELFCALPGI